VAETRRVEFNSEGRDFWTRYHEYRRLRHQESRPDDPLRPDDVEESLLKRDSPFDIHHHHEVVQDSRLVSWLSGSTSKPGTPGHETNKHLFWAYMYVRPDARRRGVGTSWLPLLVELMDAHGCTVVGLNAEEPSGHAFLRWLGAEAKFSGAENRLKLADVDWGMVDRWIGEGPKRSPDTKLESYEGPLPEAMWQDYAPQLSSLLNTIPFENLDFGEIVLTPDHMREYYARLEIGDDHLHTILTREPNSVISAITDMTWTPHRPTIIEQRFTGVRPDARGRGLGKWIKATMLRHVHELHPEAEWVTTENAGSNAPMLAINKKLGFKEFRAATEYQISRDDLAARIQRIPARKN
jgi:GNAT superfamily N-acetyltransferase